MPGQFVKELSWFLNELESWIVGKLDSWKA